MLFYRLDADSQRMTNLAIAQTKRLEKKKDEIERRADLAITHSQAMDELGTVDEPAIKGAPETQSLTDGLEDDVIDLADLYTQPEYQP